MQLPPELLIIHQPVRLKIMGLLWKQRDIAFTKAKQLLQLTDGNLATHAKKLEEAGYLAARRVLTREGFQLRYQITQQGHRAFSIYLGTLRTFLGEHDGGATPGSGTPA